VKRCKPPPILLIAPDDPALSQIIWVHFHSHLAAGKNMDAVFTQTSPDQMTVVELDTNRATVNVSDAATFGSFISPVPLLRPMPIDA